MSKPKDTYKSVKTVSEGLYKDKGSKFISFAYPVTDEEDVKNILKDIKKRYHDARHHCYAYNIGNDENRYRMNDDGEPSGTAGKPIYGQILSQGLSDILIVVVRYFGGILLGTGGLINAYKNAASSAILNSVICQKQITRRLGLRFSYEQMNVVMRIVKENNLEIYKQDFTETCCLFLNVRDSIFESMKKLFENIYGVDIEESE